MSYTSQNPKGSRRSKAQLPVLGDVERLLQSQLYTYKLVVKIGGVVLGFTIAVCGYFVSRNVEIVDDLARRVANVETRQSVNEALANEVRRELNSLNAKMDRITNQQNAVLRRRGTD